MATAEKTPRMPRTPRDRPYYDAERGERMIWPKGARKPLRYLDPPPAKFNARRALRAAGVRAGTATLEQGDRAARGVRRGVPRAVRRSGALPELGLGAGGVGNLLVYVFASIVALALLENALSGRGPAGVSSVLDIFGRGLNKLLSATDPLVPAGTVPAPVAAPSSPAGVGTSSPGGTLVPPVSVKPGPGLPGFRRVLVPRNLTQGGRTVFIDATVLPEVQTVASRFGVTVSSGYRDPAHNSEVGGAPNSDHLRGLAADFVGSPTAIQRLYAWAIQQRFPYVEPLSQSRDHVHISFRRGGAG